MLGVGHIPVSIRHPPPNEDFSVWRQWLTQAQIWNEATLELGVAALAVLGFVALCKLRPNTPAPRALFATGTVLLVFGLGSLGVALANQDYRRLEFPKNCQHCIPTAIQQNLERKFNRGIDPAPWWIAGSISTALGVTVLGASVAASHTRPAAQG